MNLEDITVRQFVVGPDNASGSPVNASNEPCFKVGMNATCQGLGMKARRNDKGIGKHTTITVHPVRFILHGIDHNVMQAVKQDVVHEVRQPRSTHTTKALTHVVKRLFLGCVE